MENLYCRFCAELKTLDGMFNLDRDLEKNMQIHIKLLFLNDIYVNILRSSDILPKTVCFACYDSLNKAYDFIVMLKKAQDKFKLLTNIPGEDGSNSDFGDDRVALEEFFSETREVPVIKEETSEVPKVKQEITTTEQSQSLEDNSNSDFYVEDSTKLVTQQESSSDGLKIESKKKTLLVNLYNNIPVYKEITNIQDDFDKHKTKQIPIEFSIDTALMKKTAKVCGVDKKIKSWKEFVWACALCDEVCTKVDVFRSHCKILHNKCAAFTCIDCEKTLKIDSFDIFVKHVRKHKEGLRNRCHYCDEIVNPDMLITHVKEHSKTLFGCPMCGDLLQDQVSLQQHLANYSEIKPKPRRKPGTPITSEELTCHICKKEFKKITYLKRHVKYNHTIERKRNYTCDRCGTSFLEKRSLTVHIMAHDQVRSYVCKICNKSFASQSKFRYHVNIHFAVKPFSCEICKRTFRLQEQLRRHKIIHTDSMPYECKYCKKTFRFKQVLDNHERLHTGIKPYSCDHCDKQFTNWSNYNKHMKRIHKLDMAKKKITPKGVFPINPKTGEIIQVDMQGMEEWKTKVMKPGKRGKKKQVKKTETSKTNKAKLRN